MMEPSGYDCKCIISESDGSNTLELYMWSVGKNPAIYFQWTDPDGTGHIEADTSGFFLDTGDYYYSANPEIFTENRLITMTMSWDDFTSKEIYFQCVNLTADTNFTVTRDLSSDDLYRVAAATDNTVPIATTTTTGIVQIGEGLNVDESGVISTPIASKETLGIVKIGDGINVDEGIISLAAATEETIGGVKPGERMTFYTNGTLDVPLATTNSPGVVQAGSGIIVDEDGVISTSGSIGVLTEYEYLTDLSAKYNGVTYTAEKDSATGLISRISDDRGNEFEPTISSGITDVAMHNAAFLAVAMLSGLGESTIMPVTAGLVGYFDYKRQCAPALWTNRLGGDNIPITGSAAVNAECLQMPNGTRGTFSMPYTDGVMTLYAILKCSDKSGTGSWNLNYVLGAGSMNKHGGMRCLCEYNETWLFANSGNAYDIVPGISAVDNYHVIAVTCDVSQNEVMYIDGVSVGSKSLPKVSYGGIWGINHLNNNGVVQEPSVLTCNLKMLAFGRTAHTAEQIATNVAWLKQYYGLR